MSAVSPTPKSYGTGDPMPRILLRNVQGQEVDTADQSIAGGPVAAWLTSGPPALDHLIGLQRLAEAFRACEAQLFVICDQPPAAGDHGDLRILIDPGGRLRQSLGLVGSGTVVADARGKIAALLPGDAFQAALQVCRTIFESSAPVTRSGGAPVLIVPIVAEPEFCRELMEYWDRGHKREDLVATDRLGQDSSKIPLKKRTDVFLQDRSLLEKLRGRLIARLFPEIHRAFRFDVARFEPPRIGCYESENSGFFGRHRDNRTKYTAHRGFAMSLNLNTGSYEGGQLRFPEYGRELYEPSAGGAIVFCCNLLHEALPVTAGRRFALFSFFADAAGAEQENRRIAAEQAAGRSGLAVNPRPGPASS